MTQPRDEAVAEPDPQPAQSLSSAPTWRFTRRVLTVGSVIAFVLAALAADGALLFLFKRQLQGVADAAARTAVLRLRSAVSVTDLQVQAEMGSVLIASGYDGNASTSSVRAAYLNADGTEAGPVGGGSIPSGATGVRVTVNGGRVPLLLAAFGQRAGMAVSVTAAAGLTNLATLTGQGKSPFILCGTQAVRLSGGSTSTVTDLLDTATTPPTLNPAYREAYFLLHDPELDQKGGGCGKGSAWRGVSNSNDTDTCATLPCAWDIIPAPSAGMARTRVAGQPGCEDNLATGCLLAVPIAVESGGGCARLTDNQLCVVTWGLFKIIQSTAFTHTGQLLDGSQFVVTSASPGRTAPPASCTLCPKTVGLLQ